MPVRRLIWTLGLLVALAGAAAVAWLFTLLGPRAEPPSPPLTPVPTEAGVDAG